MRTDPNIIIGPGTGVKEGSIAGTHGRLRVLKSVWDSLGGKWVTYHSHQNLLSKIFGFEEFLALTIDESLPEFSNQYQYQ